jgi:hypothetical protein
MQSRLTHPLARDKELVVEELGNELLIYDLRTDEAHSLGEVATRVWKACDGRTKPDAISAQLGVDDATVADAIEHLRACNLLDVGPMVVDESGSDGLTRRGLTLRAVKLGAAAAAAPLIVSIAAPAAAMAVTESFCQGIITSAKGCGDCHKFGCCCCEPPGGAQPGSKPCHADCITSPDCNVATQSNCNGSTDNCKLHHG